MSNQGEITAADRKRYFEEVMNPGTVEELIRKNLFPVAGRHLLEAAVKGEPIPEHDLELSDLDAKWLNFCAKGTKEFIERGYFPDREQGSYEEWEERVRDWKRKNRRPDFSHWLFLNDDPRPFFDFSPIKQY